MRNANRTAAVCGAIWAVCWVCRAPAVEMGKPVFERVAIGVGRDYIDGPALEAAGVDRKELAADEKGNMFFMSAFEATEISPISILRCITTDGRVITIAGDDWFLPATDAMEGPAGMLPTRLTGAERRHRGNGAYIAIRGCPLDGEEAGCVYVPVDGYPCRIFKNKEKGGRWWFKMLGRGAAALPTQVGEAVSFQDANLKGLVLAEKHMKAKGFLYGWDSEDGKITCWLTPGDYGDKALHWKTGKPLGPGEVFAVSDDGTYYVHYYNKTYPNGQVFRISKDRGQVQEIVRSVDGGKDGDGLKTGWHCGPVNIQPAFRDILLLNSQDSNCVRRWKDGRISTLCVDGEWREVYGSKGGKIHSAMGKLWVYRPGGDYIDVSYPGEERGGISGVWRFGPVDFLKPTVGAREGGESR